VVTSALVACSVPALDLGGKGCPCVAGYTCDQPRNQCVATPGGGPPSSCAVAIAARLATTCVIRSDNTVWCVGFNNQGQLGDGTTEERAVFVQASSLANIQQIALGAATMYAVDGAGKLWASGANGRHELGDGTTNASSTPIEIAAPGRTRLIVAGESHACALSTMDTLSCWGWNVNGQVGNGTMVDQPTPVQIATGVSEVVASGRRTCFIKTSDSSVWCFGKNTEGEIGDGTTNPTPTPTQIPSFTAIGLAAGGHHSCARRADNTAWCWGRNTFGQMGNGTLTEQRSPAPVPGVAGVAELFASGGRRTCARLSGGDVWCWGETPFGMRSAVPPIGIDLPMAIAALMGATVVATASTHTCAVLADGRLQCAGVNDHGQLGDGSVTAHFAFMPTSLPCP